MAIKDPLDWFHGSNCTCALLACRSRRAALPKPIRRTGPRLPIKGKKQAGSPIKRG